MLCYGLSGYTKETAKNKSGDLDSITLFHQKDFSFELSIPQQSIPNTSSEFEKQHDYEHLKDRLDNDSTVTDPIGISSLTKNIFDMINAIKFDFKFRI